MILQALNDYYRRKQAADPDALAPDGFERKEIPFVIVLHADGRVQDVRDTRDGQGKARRAKTYTVPKAVKRASNVLANLLWDNAEYVLGLRCEGRDSSDEKIAERHAAFKQKLSEELADCEDAGLSALQTFLRRLDHAALDSFPAFADLKASNGNVSFQLAGDAGLIVEREAVVARLRVKPQAADSSEGSSRIRCMVSGEQDELARLHDAIKGVWGANTSGANIVSFNLAAFNSYGKTQGSNAPIGKKAATNYVAALNALLHKDSKQRVQVGDASTVFWASKADTVVENVFALFAGNAGDDDPDASTRAVASLYAAIHNGAYIASDGDERFYVLGLAPNAARLSVRFWHAAPIREFALHIHQFFQDVELVLPGYEKRRFLPLFVLLKSIALQGESKNVPPQIAGDTLRAIIEGLPFPAALLNCALQRNKADRQQNSEASPYPFLMRQAARISLIKACLTRQARLNQQPENHLTMSLNHEDKRPPYRLGRLFAVLEKIQGDANPGLNATIRERYYGAASASPATVFPLLLRLKNHHLAKLEGGLKLNRERLLREIVDGFSDFPPQMALTDQGLFAIGYYHQMQALYVRRGADQTNTETA